MRYFMILTVLFAFVAMPAQAADLRTDADQAVSCDECGCKGDAKADKPKTDKPKADKPCDCKGKCDCKDKKAEDCGCKKDCGCKGEAKAKGDTLPCGCKKGKCKCKKDAPAPKADKK